MIQVLRRNLPALLVIGLMALRMRRDEAWSIETLFFAIAATGVLMNVVVIVANGGMPVAVEPDEIPEDQRASHHPIHERTRLALLADWIDAGWAYISPGDILIGIGAIGLIACALVESWSA